MKPIIVALDFDSKDDAINCVKKIELTQNVFVKVGMEMFYAYGPDFIYELKKYNVKIFLDVKMYDIPNTVKKAAYQIGKLGVDMVTVHATGGVKMIQAAKNGLIEGARDSSNDVPILLGITQLTSFEQEDIKYIQKTTLSLNESVVHLAKIAKKGGANGVVASALEVEMIHQQVGDHFKVITPGIRLNKDDKDDQKRVVTPSNAFSLGSDGIVVGRTITQAKDINKAYMTVKNDFLEKNND